MSNQSNPIIEREKEIQKFWEENKIFKKTLEATKSGKVFSFYDGPPFATGTPHYGHLVASIMKDAVPRYQTMRGYYVERRWGWDCHGLPIENIVEQKLGLKNRKDIEKIGIEKFNQESRASVLGYADEWKKTIPRLGRWVDMENDYKTMEPWYMESIWWVFKTLWDKSLIYEGYKSMHICPRCETTLSNFEVTQGYKDIKDLSVTVKFELKTQSAKLKTLDLSNIYILAWTTTPWTLIGNVALAVGKDIDYVLIKPKTQNPKPKITAQNLKLKENYIIAKDRLETIKGEYEIIREFKGKELVGLEYEPLFPYYLNNPSKADQASFGNLYTVVAADFVSTKDGTGVVHIAPAFGEEDMILGKEKKLPIIQHVDKSGRIKPDVKDFAGLEVKPKEKPQATDKKIIEFLGDKIFAQAEYKHSYPHCWRCDTPLINYATSSWFVKVMEVKKDLIKNNKKINWVPAHLKDGRFGKWLEEAKDWAISRSRYWGAPLPVWRCQCGEAAVIGSIEELEKLSGKKVKDLHKEVVDKLTFKCEKCGGIMQRIPEVLDCWFESGSMPYAQFHYPFENKDKFKNNFPADFIAEGVDQTRGWFYTLMVLSTALFDKPTFKNVIANGIVLAKDGKKMSKRLKNYPEPDEIMEKYGADALRFYLLSSPVMAAENLNFSEDGVKETFQKVVMLLNNILKFYKIYQPTAHRRPSITKEVNAQSTSGQWSVVSGQHILDQWLFAKLNLLIKDVSEAMEEYNLPKAVRPIQEFINEFSTWWLRRSRARFKSGDHEDKNNVLRVFQRVLLELAKIMAPFMPFIAEYIYQEVGGKLESVNLESWPVSIKVEPRQTRLLEEMEQVRKIVVLGLAARAEAGVKIRQPLASLKFSISNFQFLNNSDEFITLIQDELNVKQIIADRNIKKEVELDLTMSEELKLEGIMRELIRTINEMRKKAGLTIGDRINVYWHIKSGQAPSLEKIFANQDLVVELKKATIAKDFFEKSEQGKEMEVNGEKIKLSIDKIL